MPMQSGWKQGGNNLKFKLPKNEPKNDQETTWVRWYEGIDEDTPFTFTINRCVFKEEPKPVFYLFNENNEGVSLYCSHHESSKFKDGTPHGIRFANASIRALKLSDEVDADQIVELLNAGSHSVICKKTDKGYLWIVE